MFNLAFFSKTLQKLQFLHNFTELLGVQINSRPLLFIDYKTYSNRNFFPRYIVILKCHFWL